MTGKAVVSYEAVVPRDGRPGDSTVSSRADSVSVDGMFARQCLLSVDDGGDVIAEPARLKQLAAALGRGRSPFRVRDDWQGARATVAYWLTSLGLHNITFRFEQPPDGPPAAAGSGTGTGKRGIKGFS